MKEMSLVGLICTLYVKIGEELVNILTKGVFSSVLHSALSKLGNFRVSLRGSVEDMWF